MIKKGEPIVIQRTENGYVVRPEYRQDELIEIQRHYNGAWWRDQVRNNGTSK